MGSPAVVVPDVDTEDMLELAAADDQQPVEALAADAADPAQVALNEKAPLCGAFAKPSDGLEPSTPSLPWRCSTN